MMATFNAAQERTLSDFLELFKGSGWKLSEVIQSAPTAPAHLVLVPGA
jgi:hypothetical protein